MAVSEAPAPGTQPPGQGSRQHLFLALRWPFVVLVVLGLVWLTVDRACRSVQDGPRKAVQEAADAATAVAERFRTGRITTTFTAALPHLEPGGANLELASYEAVETFTRSDERAIFFDLIPLGTTVSEIRVPVTYRYHVRLADSWQLDVRGSVCVVRAPPLRPTLPPSLHTDRMEKRIREGWLRFDAQAQMATLEKGLTPALSARAASPASLALVRDTCRKRVAEFVRDWLLREDQWRDDRFTAVTVTFEDERTDPAALSAPTLRRSE